MPEPGADVAVVACLCAAWCHLCGDFRATFDALHNEFATLSRWRWVDIEDEAELVGAVDVETFPTLLIARGDQVLFFGPVEPRIDSVRRLVRQALGAAPLRDAEPTVSHLAARLQQETPAAD